MKQDQWISYLRRFLKLAFCFGCFYYSGYLQYIPVRIFHLTKITPNLQILLSLFSNTIAAVIIILMFWKDLKSEFQTFRKHWKEDLDIGLKYWVLGLLIMVISNQIINIFSSQHIAGNDKIVRSMIQTSPWIMFLNAGIIAPIVEELTFRKSFRILFQKKWVFALISGLIFGGMHVIGNVSNLADIFYIIPYGALGVCFGLAYYETDTIFTTISLHMMHNSLLILLPMLF